MAQEGTFRYDRFLTNLSIAYTNPAFVAEQVFPIVTVDHKTEKYPIFGADGLTPQDDLRAPGAEAKSARWKMSADSYYCDGHALKDSVPRENQADTDPAIDLLQSTTLNLTDKVRLNKEVNLVAKLDAGMTGTALSDQSAGTKLSWLHPDCDPLVVLEEGIEGVTKVSGGARPNLLTLGPPAARALRLNRNVRGRITGAVDGKVTMADIAGFLELEEVIVARAVKNTANEGQDASLSFIWGDRALLSVRPRTAGLRIMGLGFTFAWQGALRALAGAGAQGGNGYQLVERYWWQPNKADVVEVHDFYDQKIVASAAGLLMTNCAKAVA